MVGALLHNKATPHLRQSDHLKEIGGASCSAHPCARGGPVLQHYVLEKTGFPLCAGMSGACCSVRARVASHNDRPISPFFELVLPLWRFPAMVRSDQEDIAHA